MTHTHNAPTFRTTVRYYVTGARVAPHHFTPGERVKFKRAARPVGDRPSDRWLFTNGRIDQWLAAEDVERGPEDPRHAASGVGV